MIIVQTQIKDVLQEKGIQSVSKDFFPELDAKVRLLVEESVERAKQNGRKTVMGRDV